VNVPTNDGEWKDQDWFYGELQKLIETFPKIDLTNIMGDKIGQDNTENDRSLEHTHNRENSIRKAQGEQLRQVRKIKTKLKTKLSLSTHVFIYLFVFVCFAYALDWSNFEF
jgi:hypothetical protein